MVGAPYESNREFHYPTPYPKVIHTPDNRPLDTSKVEVGLAEIPFVRLRGGLDERLLKGSATFSEVVAAAQRALDSPVLEIDLDRKCIHSGGQEVPLPPAQLAFLSWLARRAKEGQPDVECPSDGVPESEYAREYLGERHLAGDRLVRDRFPQKFERPYGSLYREALLIDSSDEQLDPLARNVRASLPALMIVDTWRRGISIRPRGVPAAGGRRTTTCSLCTCVDGAGRDALVRIASSSRFSNDW